MLTHSFVSLLSSRPQQPCVDRAFSDAGIRALVAFRRRGAFAGAEDEPRAAKKEAPAQIDSHQCLALSLSAAPPLRVGVVAGGA